VATHFDMVKLDRFPPINLGQCVMAWIDNPKLEVLAMGGYVSYEMLQVK
jgi:hypothetical protein